MKENMAIAQQIVKTVELLAVDPDNNDSYELDIYDPEYSIKICCTSDRTAIIIKSKMSDMRIESVSGEIKLAQGVSSEDGAYWERKEKLL